MPDDIMTDDEIAFRAAINVLRDWGRFGIRVYAAARVMPRRSALS
jgi:hypothetical protein